MLCSHSWLQDMRPNPESTASHYCMKRPQYECHIDFSRSISDREWTKHLLNIQGCEHRHQLNAEQLLLQPIYIGQCAFVHRWRFSLISLHSSNIAAEIVQNCNIPPWYLKRKKSSTIYDRKLMINMNWKFGNESISRIGHHYCRA